MLILAEKISKEKLNELDVLGETESFFEDMVRVLSIFKGDCRQSMRNGIQI